MANSGPAPSRAVPGIVLGAALAVLAVRGAPRGWVAGRVHGAGGRSADRPPAGDDGGNGVRAWRRRPTPADRRSARPAPSVRPAERKRPHPPRRQERSRPALRASRHACRHGDACLANGAGLRTGPGATPRSSPVRSGSPPSHHSLARRLLLRSPELMAHPAQARWQSRRRQFPLPHPTPLAARPKLRPPRQPHPPPPARPKLRPPRQSSRLLPVWRPPPA